MTPDQGVGGFAPHPLFLLGFILLLILAGIWDMAERRIPNWLVGLVLLLAPLHHYYAGGWAQLTPTWVGLLGFAMLLGVLLWLFQHRMLGGGDVKLLLACQVFLGGHAAPAFLLAVALAGGVLSLAFLLARLLRRWIAQPVDQRLPYGLAIASGAFMTLGGWLNGG